MLMSDLQGAQASELCASALLAGILEGLGRAAFVCDVTGQVRGMTSQAGVLLKAGGLQVAKGRLSALEAGPNRSLEAAIAKACRGAPEASRIATLAFSRAGGGFDGLRFDVLDVIALPPAAYVFGVEPRVMVVARGQARGGGEIERLLQDAYALTASEADVAVRLGEGDSPDAIAAARGVSAGTIRTHLRSIYQKIGVNRQVELVARLRSFH